MKYGNVVATCFVFCYTRSSETKPTSFLIRILCLMSIYLIHYENSCSTIWKTSWEHENTLAGLWSRLSETKSTILLTNQWILSLTIFFLLSYQNYETTRWFPIFFAKSAPSSYFWETSDLLFLRNFFLSFFPSFLSFLCLRPTS
jgi:hypothetical protein